MKPGVINIAASIIERMKEASIPRRRKLAAPLKAKPSNDTMGHLTSALSVALSLKCGNVVVCTGRRRRSVERSDIAAWPGTRGGVKNLLHENAPGPSKNAALMSII